MGPVDAMELDFEITSEPWTTVKLEDGTVLKLRINVGKIFRLEHYDQLSGEPAYQVASKVDVRSQVPQKLKKLLTYPAPSNEDVR
jgi:hypothetical protein